MSCICVECPRRTSRSTVHSVDLFRCGFGAVCGERQCFLFRTRTAACRTRGTPLSVGQRHGAATARPLGGLLSVLSNSIIVYTWARAQTAARQRDTESESLSLTTLCVDVCARALGGNVAHPARLKQQRDTTNTGHRQTTVLQVQPMQFPVDCAGQRGARESGVYRRPGASVEHKRRRRRRAARTRLPMVITCLAAHRQRRA